MKKVSIIIPTYNEEKNISRLLKSVKKQSYKNIESIVVDDGSSDNTAHLARKYTTKVFVREHSERSVQRNFGASKASGEYLMFLDADMELEQKVVSECITEIEKNKKIAAIVIPETPVARNFWEKIKKFEREFYNLEGDCSIEAARFFSKKSYIEVGGYDEEITGPEDWDLPEKITKAGYKLSRITSHIKHYESIKSISSLLKKKYYYALRSHVYLEKNNINPVSAKTIYILRPVFYKNWRKLLSDPLMSLAMFFMLTCEQVAGVLGYLKGKFFNPENILILTSHFSPNVGGVETHLDDLVDSLSKRDYNVTVLTYIPLTTKKVNYKMIEIRKNVKIIRITWFKNLFYKLVDKPILEFIYLFPGLFFCNTICNYVA